ncbi:MAG: heterodisulfide reductase-related iron-sulfur binding cluster [Vicinamibacterales bacterium]
MSVQDVPSTRLIEQCVHCGFCLPTCPTYALWGEEMDSPRGRIYLMKAVSEQRMTIDASYVQHFDACLGCVGCVTSCPSGVQYGTLIEQARAQIEHEHVRSPLDRLFRAALLSLLPYRSRMRIALLPMMLFGGLLKAIVRTRNVGDRGSDARWTERLAALIRLAPPVSWASLRARKATDAPAIGEERLKVAVLTGCVQQLAFSHVNAATVRVLQAEGCAVTVPSDQACCGALALHAGYPDRARAFARDAIKAFDRAKVDRIVVNAAGCGSAMKEYGHLLADDPMWADRARAFSAKVRDVSEVLADLPPRAPRHPIAARVAYHDACHLAHGQQVRAQPRQLLQGIPGLELVTPAEPELCCGSAGIYNLVQPATAAELGARKVRNLAAVTPDIIATGNPGCTLQIVAAARDRGWEWSVVHPVELLDASIRGDIALLKHR